MITYSVEKSEQEGGEDFVVKTGHSHKFTMSDVAANMLELEKTQKVLAGQVELEDAKMKNVAGYHEIIGSLSDEQMNAVTVYYTSKMRKKAAEAQLDQVIKSIEGELEAIAEVEKQTGLSLNKIAE